jgi:hypothetical protein
MLNFEIITSGRTCSVETKQEQEKKSVGLAAGGNP